MSNYRRNKLNAVTMTDSPSLTDQSAAKETDINVIVATYGITGQARGKQPIHGVDWTEHPQDLRDAFEKVRELSKLRGALPEALREHKIEELLALTDDQLAHILTPPPEKPAETPKEDPK